MPSNVHRFDDFELDEGLYQLRRRGTVVRIEPKAFDLLKYLLERRDRVVPKHELLEALWPGAQGDSVLPRYVADARKALGDNASAQRIIKTVHGRGYRFVCPVEHIAASLEPAVADDSPFVGRDDAMGSLGSALDDAFEGLGRLVLLVGEPGIGKTRTASELALRAHARGAIVLTGRCHEGEGAPSLWPWVQILRSASEASELRHRASEDGIAELVPELSKERPELRAELRPLGPAEARFRLFDTITRFFARATRERTVVLLIDDLHWADKSSLILLRFVARELADMHLLVLGTYRDVELGRQHPLSEILGELARERSYARFALKGLGERDVADYVDAISKKGARPDLATAVHRMTEGNPFFMEEVVRLLVHEGKLESRVAAAELALPEGVREALGRRLNGLSDECNQVLAVASVIGRYFSPGVLERVLEMPSERMLELLDEAARHRVVVEPRGATGGYSFSHALIRETLYEELSIVRRVGLHRRIGEVLEHAHASNLGPHLAEVAHHFFQAAPGGDVKKAVLFGIRAAQRASDLLSYEEAAQHYGRVVEAMELEAVDGDTRCDVLLNLGRAQSNAGERRAARETFARVAELARELVLPERLAKAALLFGGPLDYFGMPNDDSLYELLEEARKALGDDGDPGLRAGVLSRLASMPPYSESLDSRTKLSRQAVELARVSTDPEMLSRALGARYWARLGPDHVKERLETGAELLSLSTSARDPSYAALGHEYRFGEHMTLGDVSAADRELIALEAISQKLRRAAELWVVKWFGASRALSDGLLDQAEKMMQEAFELGNQAQHPGAVVVLGGQMLWLAHDRGHSEVFAEGLDVFEEKYPWARRIRPIARAFGHAESGRLAEARVELDAVGALREIPRDEHWLTSLSMLAVACSALEDVPRCSELYDLLTPYAGLATVHGLLRVHSGPVAYYLGLLAWTLRHRGEEARRFEEALDLLEQAREMNDKMGARPHLARGLLQRARVLVEHGDRDDLPRAREAVVRALELATEIGMNAVRASAAQLLDHVERVR